MSFAWFVASRYLTAKRKQAFISLISGVSIVGVGVGVMAVIIALALMTGVQGELRDRIVGSSAHVYVYKTGDYGPDVSGELREMMIPGVVAGAPAVMGIGLLSSNAADAVPVQLKGIDPALESHVTDIQKSVISGSLQALVNRRQDQKEGIVLGVDLARTLGVRVGDLVLLMTDRLEVGPGIARPRTRPHEVVGIVRFGFYQTDASAAFLSLEAAEDILGKPGPQLIQLRVANLDDAPRLRGELEKKLGIGYTIDDWTEINHELYAALWLEKVGISLAVGLVVVVAALNIVASLVLLVMEKTRDIAILRTMGASAQSIRRVFVYQGLAIGVLGTGVGAVLGLVACFLADRYQLLKLPSDVYQITHVPFRVLPLDFTVVVLSALAICFVATIYPSRRAGRLDPAEALRHQ
jgi:lipoprotein-releasing system permease protein